MNEKIYYKKSLGQNFLIDNNIKNRIVNALKIANQENIMEIGPGNGALTEILAKQTKNLILIEKDSDLADSLKYRFENITVIKKDFLEYQLPNNKIFKIIGNLPYNVSTQIIFKILKNYKSFTKGIFMVQKEVADRMLASFNCKDYSLLSVIIQTFSEHKRLFNVSPNCFKPKPKVFSTVIDLNIKNLYNINDFDKFFLFVKALFYGRRKKLVNVIQNNPFLKFNKDFLNNYKNKFNNNARINELKIEDIIYLYKLWSNNENN